MKLRVVQCWDDGVESDRRLTDLLRQHGAKASFNLNPDLHQRPEDSAWLYQNVHPVRRLPWAELTAVYEGFTIANHTCTHPWPTRIPLATWRAEVVDARHRLQDKFGQPVAGFAYPFGDFNDATAAVVGEAGHVYGRTCEQAEVLPGANPLATPTSGHVNMPDFWDSYEAAKRQPNGVFWFWGHSYEFTDEAAWQAFEQKIRRISADPDAEWAELPGVFA
ncbi:MAG: polysaccharide deacetylase family protein [Spirochaetales bacterium]